MTIAASLPLGADPGRTRRRRRRGRSPVQVGYGVSLTDFGGFQQSLRSAGGAPGGARRAARPARPRKQLMKPFEHINGEAARLADEAQGGAGRGPRDDARARW